MIWKFVHGFIQGFVSDQVGTNTVWGDSGKGVLGNSMNHNVLGIGPLDGQGNSMNRDFYGNNKDFYGNDKS